MEKLRCFIAIELPPEIKKQLDALEERLKSGQHPFVKWVDPEGIHLTLKFLGSISSDTVSGVIQGVARALKGVSPFNLQLGGLGAFPNWQRPQVIWVGVRGEVEKVVSLQRGIETILSPLGFPPESRSFSPHLTLARLREGVSSPEKHRFGEWAGGTEFAAPHAFEVNGVSLMRSELTPSGPIYSRLAWVELEQAQG
jgi:2'-5' RNA ligase